MEFIIDENPKNNNSFISGSRVKSNLGVGKKYFLILSQLLLGVRDLYFIEKDFSIIGEKSGTFKQFLTDSSFVRYPAIDQFDVIAFSFIGS